MEEISINVSLEVGITDPNKSGPSHFTRKRRFDHQEEVVVAPVAMGHPLENLDLVVHPLQPEAILKQVAFSDSKALLAFASASNSMPVGCLLSALVKAGRQAKSKNKDFFITNSLYVTAAQPQIPQMPGSV